MYSFYRRPSITRTILPPSLARGGTARLVALLFVFLLAIPSICLCQGSGDIFARSSSLITGGAVSTGYFQKGYFVEYNTQFTVCDGVIGWCLDKCPGPEGDVTLNITREPITHNGFTWLPGILYANPGFGSKGVAIRFTPPRLQAVNCVGSFAVKPDSMDTARVQVTKGSTALRNSVMDSAQKQDSVVLSSMAQAGPRDSIYFSIYNTGNERCDLVGVHLSVTPVDAKNKTREKLSFAVVVGKR
jgi:hypothetical protein